MVQSWDDHRETVADLMIETVNDHAPNFRRSVLARQIFSPLDLERTFGLIGGDIFHGALDLRQIFSARPMLGYADYRGPIAGLYLCGSGGHPGGGVTGAMEPLVPFPFASPTKFSRFVQEPD